MNLKRVLIALTMAVATGLPLAAQFPSNEKVDLDAVYQCAVGCDHAGDPCRGLLVETLGVALQGPLGDAALATDLEPLLECGSGIVRAPASRP